MRSWLLSICCLLTVSQKISAQVVPDDTLPQNSQTTIDGDTIDISGGTVAGENLFHSFEQFSIAIDNIAAFDNSLSIQNIISRVTGDSISDIDGLIRANGTANLFLINPNGIVFGENASLDIGGSFIATTADRLNFADGTEFAARPSNSESLLTVSIPLGLQFGSSPGDIEVRGTGNNLSINPDTLNVDRSDRPRGLAVGQDRTLALVGGNIALTGGNLTTDGGRVAIGSLGAGAIELTTDGAGWEFNYDRAVSFQNIDLSQGASIEASSNGGGDIQLQGKDISIVDGSAILADTLGDEPGGLLSITAETLEVAGSAEGNFFTSRLSTDVDLGAEGNGGDLLIQSDRLSIADGAQINAGVFGTGEGGDLTVRANEVEIIGDSASTGLASGLFAQPDLGQTGDGGDLTIDTKSLLVADGAQISTTTFGMGDAGNLSLSAETVELIGFSNASPSIIAVNAESQGNGGNLSLFTGTLLIADGAQISANAFDTGSTGKLEIIANEVELLAGAPGFGSSGIFANVEAGSSGNVSGIAINTNSLAIAAGAQISSTSFGSGNTGDIEISANDIELSGTSPNGNPSAIFSNVLTPDDTVEPSETEPTGNIIIDTNKLEIFTGAQIATSTLSSRSAGDLNIQARSIEIEGSSPNGSSGLFANALVSDGAGGNLTVEADLLDLNDNASINVGNFSSNSNSGLASGRGAAGNLSISADKIDLSQGASLTADTFIGDRGNIEIKSDLLFLSGGSNISTNAQLDASGGNIAIDASNGFLVAAPIENSDITANAVFGTGGRVDIDALEVFGIEPRLQLTSLSDITASSEFGVAGNVELDTQALNRAREVSKLPNNFIAPDLLQGCQDKVRDASDNSSFSNLGRGGVRPQPRELLESDDFIDDVQIPDQLFDSETALTNSESQTSKIIEAKGWIVNQQGKVELVKHTQSSATTQFSCEFDSASN